MGARLSGSMGAQHSIFAAFERPALQDPRFYSIVVVFTEVCMNLSELISRNMCPSKNVGKTHIIITPNENIERHAGESAHSVYCKTLAKLKILTLSTPLERKCTNFSMF